MSHKTKADRKREAAERQRAADARSADEQFVRLAARPGDAIKERGKLEVQRVRGGRAGG